MVVSEPALRIRDLSHWFETSDAGKPVLSEINLDLDPGEIAVITGPSGSGKTTLLTLIGALRSVQQGSLCVLGHEYRGLSRAGLVTMRRNIGFIFQAHNLFDSLTAVQNVRMALDLTGLAAREARERAIEILSRLGLDHRLDEKPAALSGGQRQRVAIARALVTRPRLILADEPTAALDKDASREVVHLLQDLARQEGTAIALVTHDARILDVADRIVNLVDGRIVSDVKVAEALRICEFLPRCPVFADLAPTVLSEIANRMVREQYAAGSTIIRQGDLGDRFYVIRSGSAEVTRPQGPDGWTRVRLREGEFFGEMALITGEPRNASVVAAEPLELYVLRKDDFHAALEANAPFREQLLKVFFQRQ